MTKKRGRPKGSKNKKKLIQQNTEEVELNLERAKTNLITGMIINFPLFSSFCLLLSVVLEISGDIKEIKKELKNEQI